MVEKDREAFSEAIFAMFASLGAEATVDHIRGFWMGLCDLELLDVQTAVARAIKEFSTLPKPADLRRLSGVMTSGQRAIAAWSDVLRAVVFGPYRHIDFQDKICNAVIRSLGGWPSFVSRFTDADAEKWARIEFIKVYESFMNSGVNGEICRALPGLSQVESRGGYVGEPIPVSIGCDSNRLISESSQRPARQALIPMFRPIPTEKAEHV